MKQNLSESIMANLKENDDKKFRYSLLSRLESDCKYFCWVNGPLLSCDIGNVRVVSTSLTYGDCT